MWDEGYAVEAKDMEDYGEGTLTGAEKKREEWIQVVAEDTGKAKGRRK
jgi:hypothetical protein